MEKPVPGKPIALPDKSPKRLARIMILCPQPRLPHNLDGLLRRKDVQCSWVPSYEHADKDRFLGEFDLVVCFPGQVAHVEHKRRLGKILLSAQQGIVPVIFLSDDPTLVNLVPVEPDRVVPRMQTVSPLASNDELWGRICAMLDFSPLFDRIDQYTNQLEKWAYALNNRFEELHQELRLAWRVQQDFLPKRLPHCPRVSVATLYRPASWVSGDIFDIFQLDENNIGFFVADVVGHGVAAGLMTLFVKRALATKEVTGHSYRLLPPDQALQRLNDDLCDLELPEHQFVTGLYGIINTETLNLSLARAGHPHPVLFAPVGSPIDLKVDGSLLGVFPGNTFARKDTVLAPGSKLVIFTDGLEQAFGTEHGSVLMLETLTKLVHLSADQFIEALNAELDCQENSLHPGDDITVIILETTA